MKRIEKKRVKKLKKKKKTGINIIILGTEVEVEGVKMGTDMHRTV